MKTAYIYALILSAVCILSTPLYGNGRIHIKKTPLLSSQPAISSSDIRSIEATGPFHLIIDNEENIEPSPSLLDCQSCSTASFESKIKDRTLYLTAPKDTSIRIKASHLQSLSVKGLQTVTLKSTIPLQLTIHAEDIYALHLIGNFTIPKLSIQGNSNVYGHGQFNIYQLNHHSSGTVDIDQLFAPVTFITDTGSGHLSLKGRVDALNILKSESGILDLYTETTSLMLQATGKGQILLTGYAHQFETAISDHLILDASHLIVQHLFIKAHDHSFAKVYPISRLFAAAYDNSRIHYYHEPHHLYIFPYGNDRVFYFPKNDFAFIFDPALLRLSI